MTHHRAILTGASQGIGRCIASALADRGYELLLTARSESSLRSVQLELAGRGGRVAITPADLSDPDAPARIAAAAERELGGVDVLVNNAATEPQIRFHETPVWKLEEIVRVNLIAPVTLARHLLPSMLEHGHGHIVNISSLAGRTSFPFTEAYAATKDGLIGFSRVLRNDYRGTGVSASSIILGAVKEAGLTQRTLDETGLKANTTFFASPEKVARAVLRAIERDKAEIVVAPGPGRLMKALLDLFPGLGPAMNRMTGIEKTMSTVADYREGQRTPHTVEAVD